MLNVNKDPNMHVICKQKERVAAKPKTQMTQLTIRRSFNNDHEQVWCVDCVWFDDSLHRGLYLQELQLYGRPSSVCRSKHGHETNNVAVRLICTHIRKDSCVRMCLYEHKKSCGINRSTRSGKTWISQCWLWLEFSLWMQNKQKHEK